MSHPSATTDDPLAGDSGSVGYSSRLVELNKRLAYVLESYLLARRFLAGTNGYNQSLVHMKKAVNPKARRSPQKVKCDPSLNLLIWDRANRHAVARRSDTPANCDDVFAASRELSVELKAKRGRPADDLLIHHVQGLMVLVEWATGVPVTASLSKDSCYEPRLASSSAAHLENICKTIEPTLTRTALVNIIRSTHSSSAIKGKRFGDFFPFYGGSVDPDSGAPRPGPGYVLERFETTPPIYFH